MRRDVPVGNCKSTPLALCVSGVDVNPALELILHPSIGRVLAACLPRGKSRQVHGSVIKMR